MDTVGPESDGQVSDSSLGTDLFEKLKENLAGHYEIQRELGEGGMAIVFLAHDVKHDRDVAVKVLKPELAASLGAERFLREIRTAAKLSHPHILPLYDSGDAGGVLYYVMPFVQGESLADLLEREQQLGIDEAIKIAREVAEGLGVAHSYGLVHRDIKPDNIMMSGGHAILADFGIARAVNEAGGEKLTQTGMSVGTPAYMSPEQAAGDPNTDGRSDIYSLGCVLYEMLVGQIPFTGPTPLAIMARHTMDQISPPSIQRDSIPPELEDIIFCAMSKTAADRFKTGQEMAEALAAVEAGAVPKLRRSTVMHRRASSLYVAPQVPTWKRMAVPAGIGAAVVVVGGLLITQLRPGGGGSGPTLLDATGLDPTNVAVLYFQDLTSGQSASHIADGLTEGLIDNLRQVRGIDVVSPNGVASYSDPAIPPDSVARALSVGTVVSGTVEQTADTMLRINVSLIDGNSGTPFERQNITVPLEQVLTAQDSLARAVTNLLRRFLGEEVRLRDLKGSTSSPVAWSLVARAERLRKDARSVGRDDTERTMALLSQADSILKVAESADPSWPEPIVLRGWIANTRASLEREPEIQDAWADSGLALAERALSIQPQNPKALELRGTMRYWSWFYGAEPAPDETARLLSGAEADLRAAAQGDRSLLASAYSTLSFVLLDQDKKVDANIAAVQAYEADAYLENVQRLLWLLFRTSYDLENTAQAKQWCETSYQRFPKNADFVACQLWLFTTNRVEPDVDRAWRFASELQALSSEDEWEGVYWGRRESHMLVAAAIARAGMADSAEAVLSRSRGNPEVDPDRVLLTREALVRVLLNQKDEAIRLLSEYYTYNPHHRPSETDDINWWWRSIQDDPGFRALLRPAR